jgi:hypothetical protein
MKQRLTKKPDFQKLSIDRQYKLLHETQLRVQRLERITEGLLFWQNGSVPFSAVAAEYMDYVDKDNS